MIFGVDETGNFDEKSSKLHFFVSVVLQTENKNLDIKLNQFKEWENSVPESLKNTKGEIKGSLLNDEHINSFILKVYLREPFVFTSYISIRPTDNSIEIIEKHQLFELMQMENNIKKFESLDSKKSNLNFLKQYAKWLGKRSAREYLKMTCLKHCLHDSLKNAMMRFIGSYKTNELINIQYKIDHDFLNDENIYWSEYLRRSIQYMSNQRPFPILDTWTDKNPFLKKYSIVMPNGENGINLNAIFKDNINFLDSNEHPEIRIADIVAIILNRFWNNNELKWAHSIIEKTHSTKNSHTEIRLNDFNTEQKFKEFKT